jgi:chromosome segregation ATPase
MSATLESLQAQIDRLEEEAENREERIRALERRQAKLDAGVEALTLAVRAMRKRNDGSLNGIMPEAAKRHLAVAIALLGIQVPEAALPQGDPPP